MAYGFMSHFSFVNVGELLNRITERTREWHNRRW